MASNPMQRKARVSFLLGMFVMLVISGVVIAILIMQLMNRIKKEQEDLKLSAQVCVLNTNVKSGQVITEDMIERQTVNKNFIPSNATSDVTILTNYALQDKEGNSIYTKYDKEGNAKLYIKKDNQEYEVKQEEETENYYIEKNGGKDYLQLNSVPLIAKVTMNKNTVLTTELLNKGDSVVQDDIRKQEYNMFILPMDLLSGDYIDVRLMLPSGQDYIVVSKKEVEIPTINGTDSEDTIWINLSEDEILHMSCAIVDAYKINGSKLYVTKYTEAGMQKAAIPTYPLNESTTRLLQSDPNVLAKAMNEIRTRYSTINGSTLRNDYINAVINSQGEQAQSNLETNMQESITNSKNSRKQYLDSLSTPTAGSLE